MKKILAVLLSAVLTLSLVACGGSKSQTTTSASGEKVIKIGVFEPQTGENGGGVMQI